MESGAAGRPGTGVGGRPVPLLTATGSGGAKAREGAAQGPTLGLMPCHFGLKILSDLCPRSQSRGHSAAPASRSLVPQGHTRVRTERPSHPLEGKLGLQLPRLSQTGFQDCTLGPLHFQKLGFF